MSETPTQTLSRPGVLSLTIKEKSALYAAYMPYLKGGGLFIPTPKSYHLGDEVFLLVSLMDDQSKFQVVGQIVWITPAGAQGGKSQGIGVQFGDNDNGIALRNRIETLLGGAAMKSTRQTHTM